MMLELCSTVRSDQCATISLTYSVSAVRSVWCAVIVQFNQTTVLC